MFTGIVTHRGRVVNTQAIGSGNGEGDSLVRLTLDTGTPLNVGIGDSVALDGVCLTVVRTEGAQLDFEAVPETLRLTSLGQRVVGDEVNVEAALKAGDAMGGHWVQGHVDGTGHVTDVERQGDDVRMVIEVSERLHEGLIPKGSVTVDGVSLTVGEVWREDGDAKRGRFSIYLIPHTLDVTGLGGRKPGDQVNIEVDVVGRWVAHHVQRALQGIELPTDVGGSGIAGSEHAGENA